MRTRIGITTVARTGYLVLMRESERSSSSLKLLRTVLPAFPDYPSTIAPPSPTTQPSTTSYSITHLDFPFILFDILLISLCSLHVRRTDPINTPSKPLEPGKDPVKRDSTHLEGFGSFNRLWTLVNIAATSYVGLQRFCKMSRQSSPL